MQAIIFFFFKYVLSQHMVLCLITVTGISLLIPSKN